MSMSNRFEVESLARKRQAELEQSLRRSAQLAEGQPRPDRSVERARFRASLIMTATAAVSLLVALGLSSAMAFAIAVVR